METPIPVVKAKLYCPPETAGFIARQRLLDVLGGSLERPLTLVCAPAGYGKSVLVSDWTRSLDVPVAWVILDETESELSQFLAYLLSALDSLCLGAFASTRQWLANPELPSVSVIAHELINEILAVDKQLVLVLDDFHKIDHGSAVHEMLDVFFRHPPANFHLLLVTRRDPPLALAMMRANNQLIELRQADLRFDKAEATEMVSAACGDFVESAWINDLQNSMEGWAAGLRMVTLAAQRFGDSGRSLSAVPEVSHQIHEYLQQEVIEALPPSTQYMLYCSAIPEKFCAGLLDSLVEHIPEYGESDGGTMPDGVEFIQRAQQENMFISVCDSSGTWYRYHHLFRELLLQLFQSRLPDEERTSTRAKAASLLEELGMLNDAIRVYVDAGRFREAAEVVDRHRGNALDEDSWLKMESWLQLFPAGEIKKWPGTSLARAWIAQYRIDEDLISDLVRQLESIEKQQGLTSSQLVELNYFRGFPLFWSGDIKGARSMYESADIASCGLGAIRGEIEAYLAMSRALDGAKELALKRIEEVKVSDAGKRGVLATRVTAAELYIHYFSLAVASATRSAARLAMISASDFDSIYARAWASVMNGMILFNSGRFEDAVLAFQQAGTGKRVLESRAYIDVLAGKVTCLAILEEWEILESALSELESFPVASGIDVHRSEILTSVRARSSLLRRDLESATNYAQEIPELPATGNLLFWLEEPAITRIRVNLARGKPGSVSAALKSIIAIRENTVPQGLLCQDIDLMLLEAVARHQQGELDVPLALLREALSYAVPARWSRPFIELGQLLHPIVQHDALDEECMDFLRVHCRLADAGQPKSTGRVEVSDLTQCAGLSLEHFTNRELDILELLAQRYRNKEIAAQLHISTHTVNYHLKHIYQKLDVSGRRKAVTRAIELGILAV